MAKRVRVRYAPSPTGLQHIGGVRTALFNYLFARNQGGDFILRIEDTDQSRYFDGALDDIFSTFKWLGIDYDEGPVKEGPYKPYFQSQRLELYKKYAEMLVEKGWAYYCYCDSARLERIKNIQAANKLPPGYDRHCRTLSEEEKEELKKSGITPVIRFKAPLEGTTFFEDKILGKIEVENSTLQDFILLKSDGFPTYHMANIVDDHLMEITHVLRAQEWIPSTPNHVLLYKAFGWEAPQFCHLPMVMGEDGQKLSKRHGSTHLIEFKNNGYLPEAIVNFVSLLGWSYNDKDELFSLSDLEKSFDIERINKAPAVFNYGKLKWFNGVYIRKLTMDKLLELTLPHYQKANLVSQNPTNEEIDYLKKILPLVQERLELINDAPALSDFMYGDIPPYKTWEAILPKNVEKDTVIKILTDAKEILTNFGKEKNEDLQHKLYELTEKHKVKAGSIFMPIRIAITGINKSPELFPVMEVLGLERVFKRLDAAIEKLKN
ncbi:MAG: glutamate--tRNA ligase [Spirochaetes bacterium GWD1_27_9]|nr:MAG: glutamate--tRNA ligase [Spirochaetes bacterium GWD1_27_9]